MSWYLPMNFSYGANGLPGNQPTTFDEIFQGKRRSTLRKPGQLPQWVQPGQVIEVRDKQGRSGKVKVTGRRIVTSDMVNELSQVERWTPDFLRSYMRGQPMEQLLYEPVQAASSPPTRITKLNPGEVFVFNPFVPQQLELLP